MTILSRIGAIRDALTVALGDGIKTIAITEVMP